MIRNNNNKKNSQEQKFAHFIMGIANHVNDIFFPFAKSLIELMPIINREGCFRVSKFC